MAFALRRTAPPEPAAPPAAEVEPAAAYLAASERWQRFLAEREAAHQWVAEVVGELRSDDRSRPVETVERQLAEAVAARDKVVLRLGVEREAWDLACSREVERVGKLLQPRHRQAVARIAEALTSLCAAIAAERAVRAELREAVPGASADCLLPDASGQLGLGSLDDYSSAASAWNRDMLTLGLLS